MVCGILIPELHKAKNENLSIQPVMGINHQGMSIIYHLTK
jgi:hypothetical protein